MSDRLYVDVSSTDLGSQRIAVTCALHFLYSELYHESLFEQITIEDTVNNHTVVFPCSRWLAANADDGMIERQLIGDDFDNRGNN